jgi:hypothetical protein
MFMLYACAVCAVRAVCAVCAVWRVGDPTGWVPPFVRVGSMARLVILFRARKSHLAKLSQLTPKPTHPYPPPRQNSAATNPTPLTTANPPVKEPHVLLQTPPVLRKLR